MKYPRHLPFLLMILAFACAPKNPVQRTRIDLSGIWQFAMDTTGVGETQKWFTRTLKDSISLPGTMDLNQKGFPNHDTTTLHLNRLYTYEGAAWYQKTIIVPENFADQHLILHLERTKPSKLWIDSTYIGTSRLLQSPQDYDISACLTPGPHTITLLINNDLHLTPYGNVHIYSDDTQTNWNGMLGELYIEASTRTYIRQVRVFPDIQHKNVRVKLSIDNQLNLETVTIRLAAELHSGDELIPLQTVTSNVACKNEIELTYELGENCQLWDEYQQPLYKLTATLSEGEIQDSQTVPFGMREFSVKGTQFAINDRITFLRGKHEAAVFPFTGFPPMNVDDWRRVFRIAKEYGINHYRFHSYCPPEAAFTAADLEGIYIQAETPFWGGLESDSLATMLRTEGLAMLDAYANHPSFVMFSHGNEIWSGHNRLDSNLQAWKAHDDRVLYAMGSNNNIGYVSPPESADYFVAARTPSEGDTMLTHTRLTHAFADTRDGGILNTQIPSTNINFDYPITHMNRPLVSHEIGQYQIYPDYKEISKYTGVLRAWNLDIFRERLRKAGLADMDSAFQRASGAWSALCYKAEMEAALRTRGMAGFQLLDLQDFPGQGTALVGILDAFMDSKQVITPEEWKESCNDVVLLLEMNKYCWTPSETFDGTLTIANYSNRVITGNVTWKIADQENQLLQEGMFEQVSIQNQGLSTIGNIPIDLSRLNPPQQLSLTLAISGTEYTHTYPLWIYPADEEIEQPANVLVTQKLNQETLAHLQNGERVLYFPKTEAIRKHSVPGLFPPDFWNYDMFKSISESNNKPVSPGTLGILTQPEHPIFKNFPTDFHTNWQWFSIIKGSNSFILNDTESSYHPIVAIIDNLQRTHKMGLIFEFKVGEGKLLVCTSQLPDLLEFPEARQLYRSILDYMKSEYFEPDYSITESKLKSLYN